MANMSFAEAKQFVARVHTYDNRRVDVATIEMWRDLLDGYTYDECVWAFRRFVLNRPGEYLNPGHIVSIVNEKRAEYRMMNPSRHLEPDAWLEFEAMLGLASEQNKIIQASASRSAVEAMESGDFDG